MHKHGNQKPIFITRDNALIRMAKELSFQPIIAVDTESNSLFAYREAVCLIQISTDKKDFLVDTLAVKDLSSLHPIFASNQIEKVFHAAEYDMRMLKRDFDFTFNNLFDTMIASRIVGKKKAGLRALLGNYFGIKVDKKYQKANWGKRPISPGMIAYAQNDTHYLISLRNFLIEELKNIGRWELAQEDFNRVANTSKLEERSAKLDCWKINGAGRLSPRQTAILVELCAMRDKIAIKRNVPIFKVISDRILMDIAKRTPGTITDLDKIESMPSVIVERYGEAILAAIQKGKLSTPPKKMRTKRATDEQVMRLEHLRTWRRRQAKRINVESDVVLPRDILDAISIQNPSEFELKKIMQTVPHRFQLYGEDILRELRRIG